AICNQDIEPYASNCLYWNTYERDWFNSSKLLGHASKNGGDIYLYGNRKYFNEWYAGSLLSRKLPIRFNFYSLQLPKNIFEFKREFRVQSLQHILMFYYIITSSW